MSLPRCLAKYAVHFVTFIAAISRSLLTAMYGAMWLSMWHYSHKRSTGRVDKTFDVNDMLRPHQPHRLQEHK